MSFHRIYYEKLRFSCGIILYILMVEKANLNDKQRRLTTFIIQLLVEHSKNVIRIKKETYVSIIFILLNFCPLYSEEKSSCFSLIFLSYISPPPPQFMTTTSHSQLWANLLCGIWSSSQFYHDPLCLSDLSIVVFLIVPI